MSILRAAINRLCLDPSAPYPSQVLIQQQEAFDVRQKLKEWRETQRMHLVKDESDRDE